MCKRRQMNAQPNGRWFLTRPYIITYQGNSVFCDSKSIDKKVKCWLSAHFFLRRWWLCEMHVVRGGKNLRENSVSLYLITSSIATTSATSHCHCYCHCHNKHYTQYFHNDFGHFAQFWVQSILSFFPSFLTQSGFELPAVLHTLLHHMPLLNHYLTTT